MRNKKELPFRAAPFTVIINRALLRTWNRSGRSRRTFFRRKCRKALWGFPYFGQLPQQPYFRHIFRCDADGSCSWDNPHSRPDTKDENPGSSPYTEPPSCRSRKFGNRSGRCATGLFDIPYCFLLSFSRKSMLSI